ncbi:MAG: hypothetical protein PF795_03840 [Kiritimatiellae bacterium]|jgi:hypothetical protein|nr:hypothetical protein [Kiritimatiellia bacterium]
MKTFFRHVLFVLCLSHLAGFAGDMWIEGEDYTDSTVKRHPWWYEKVVESHLSGGKLVAHFTEEGPGTVRYDVQVPEDGDYHLWVRANPVQTRMGFRVNGGEATVVELSKTARDQVNIAADGKADLRFLAWARLDTIRLDEGRHTLEFTFDGSNRSIQHHGMLDAFLLTTRDFSPRGTMTPAEIERADAEQAETDKEWIPWTPGTDPFEASPIDLRYLNEEVAGQSGFIGARDGRFVFPDGRPVRFWAVNGGGDIDESNAGIFARMLAKYGVNLVRLHSAVFDR